MAGQGGPWQSCWRHSTRPAWRPSSTWTAARASPSAPHYAKYAGAHPTRFAHVAQLAYEEWIERPDFGEMEARRFEDSVRRGAVGIKAWKPLGLRARDPQGKVVPVDDPRLDPLWAVGAKTGAVIDRPRG